MLELSRDQILAHRRLASGLDRRLANSDLALEKAAAAGLQDSMPRAALLSIHARVSDAGPTAWAEPPLAQVWGPRYSAYVIARRDLALFTLGRLSEEPKALQRAQDTADRLAVAIGDQRMDVRDAARIVGGHPNALRYAAPTGRFLIYWDGARQPLIWRVPAPQVEPRDARIELARRFLHVFGPGTPGSFASWAGLRPKPASAAFDDLEDELLPVQTPIGSRFILAADETGFRQSDGGAAIRLLPSGDPYYLLQGADRELLVPDATRRNQLWTSRVWPGAVLDAGEIVGTWRRREHKVTLSAWLELKRPVRAAIEREAESLPLPGLTRPISVEWDG